MSLLQTVVLPALNGKYETKVKSFEEVTNDKGGYVKVILELPDREYQYNIFPTQVDYVTSALRSQFDKRGEAVSLGDMLTLGKTKSFNVWFAYNQDVGRMNVALHEPRVIVQESEVGAF